MLKIKMTNRLYHLWDKEGEKEEEWKSFYRFANSYKKASQILIENEIDKAKKGFNYDDEDILPILLNFFQFVELSLKSLLSRKMKVMKTHNLKELIEKVEKEYDNFSLSKNSKEFLFGLDFVDKKINFLEYMRLKYPTDNKGKKYWIEENGSSTCLCLDGICHIIKIVIMEFEKYFKNFTI